VFQLLVVLALEERSEPDTDLDYVEETSYGRALKVREI